MTEEDAIIWCRERFGETKLAVLDRFRSLLLEENERQNLISPSSRDTIWNRHLVDSAQLLHHSTARPQTWFDIGSGPGLPGLVVAILSGVYVTLVEPRARRVAFLESSAAKLGLTNVTVVKSKAEGAVGRADIVTARAVADIPALVTMTGHLRHSRTRLILPRGKNGGSEVKALPAKWRGMFHVEQSVTDPASVIVIADGVEA